MMITDLYKKYSIPTNLQQHMFRVAALGNIICDHLRNIQADKDIITQMLLLHDMGNILKFDFSNLDLFDEEDKSQIDKYRKAQHEFKKKYGNHPDEATVSIIEETASNSKVLELYKNSHWENAKDFVNSEHWDRKIACYSDMRIGPFGILSLKERFDNLISRRPETKQRLNELYSDGKKLEKQLQDTTTNNLLTIDDEILNKRFQYLQHLNIS